MIQGYSSTGNISSKNISEAYMSLPSNRVIEGQVISKDGKNLRIEDKNGTVMDLKLKKEVDIVKGETLEISRRDIESIEVVGQEKLKSELEAFKTDEKILKDLGLEASDINVEALKNLKRFEIHISKENIEKFVAIKETLESLKENLNFESIAKLEKAGYDIDSMSIWEVKSVVEKVLISEIDMNLEILKSQAKKELSYDEARKIAKEIYNVDMGKDILDTIKALFKMDIPITKSNIDNIHDVFSKMYNIKDVDNKVLIDAIKLEESLSIDLIYKLKNYIQSSSIASGISNSVAYGASSVRPLTENDLKNMENEIKRFIADIGLTEADIDISKDLLRKNQGITKEAVDKIKDVRNMLAELQKLMDKDTAAYLIKKGVDIGSKDVKSLLDMVKEFQKELQTLEIQQFTKEELLKANKLIEAVKTISKNKIVSENAKLSTLISDKKHNSDYGFLFSETRELKVLSKADTILLRTASILQNVESLNNVSISSYNSTVSLLDIGKAAQRIPSQFTYSSSFETLEFESYSVENRLDNNNEAVNKTEAYKHYEYLRINIRSVHIYSMVREGIDPLTSDIRSMGRYVEQYEFKSSHYELNNMSSFDISKISSDIVKNPSISGLKSVVAASDNLKPKSLPTQIIDKIMEEADKKQINEISKLMRSTVSTLENTDKMSKDSYRENMTMLYQHMKETEEIVKTLKKEDKEIFEKYLRQMSEYIKESSKLPKEESMLQIPFYMNQEGSQANVFVKTPKKKDKIDPEDMSILMDLSTKGLGNLGFYLKVEHKSISVKISAGENVLSSIKNEMTSLENLLQNIGYELKKVELSGDEDTAKISFVEETARQLPSGLDLKV
ncbi:DUF6240 domain-containing protein [Acetoanaerobium noterae]|uniref:DUF6240 domain-containing protein n=1 Tax=Acetoanaerobium noterae TaxID=745369 RepID=UPI0028ABA941|nr:DUF6240 domain-containing protein [Acetoanaerobium noterae]